MNPHASQASNASKADQDSPFALLMAASAPKEDEPVRAPEETQKPANDQSAAQPAPVKQQTRTQAKKTDEKTKPDENKTAGDGGEDKKEEVANDNTAPAPTPDTKPVAASPVPPPQPVVPLIVIADAVASETPAPEVTAPVVTPTQPATQPAADLAAQTAANDAAVQTKPAALVAAQTQAAPQPQQQQAAAPQAAQTPTQQTPVAQASVPQTPVSETSQETVDPQPAAPLLVVQPVAAQQADATQSIQTVPAAAKETLVQIATLQNPSSAKPAEASEQTDTAASASTDLRTDAAKPVPHDLPAQHAENKDVKADAPRPEIAKPDTVKPDAPQPAPVETAAPKSPPQVQTPPSTSIGAAHANAVLQPQTAMPGAQPGIPQHVQVSAEAAKPNMPALAVEIAAKSQSGAKQFDIRLDPPELGRVEVRLSIDAAGKASAHLSADQPQTLELLQKDSSSLTRALREAGLNVSQDGLNFSLRQQSHDGGTAQQGHGQGRTAARGLNLVATNSIDATQNSASWRGDGRLDIRV